MPHHKRKRSKAQGRLPAMQAVEAERQQDGRAEAGETGLAPRLGRDGLGHSWTSRARGQSVVLAPHGKYLPWMRVPWPDQRCVVCLERPRADDEQTQMTDGHVLPQSVGGKLSAPFLCRRCNSKMGEAEAILPRDVTVRLIVDRLEHELPPELVKTIRYRQGYFADTEEYGRISAGMDREGELTPRQSETIKDDENTLRQIASELRRHGPDEEEIVKQQEAFGQAPPGDQLEVTPEFTVTKGIDFSAIPFRPNLDDPLTPPRVPCSQVGARWSPRFTPTVALSGMIGRQSRRLNPSWIGPVS